jgi:hypothetical protein
MQRPATTLLLEASQGHLAVMFPREEIEADALAELRVPLHTSPHTDRMRSSLTQQSCPEEHPNQIIWNGCIEHAEICLLMQTMCYRHDNGATARCRQVRATCRRHKMALSSRGRTKTASSTARHITKRRYSTPPRASKLGECWNGRLY